MIEQLRLDFTVPPRAQVPSRIVVATRRGRSTYDLVEVLPYRRRDGGASHIVRWRSTCRKCGAEFTTTTPVSGRPPEVVHCEAHRKRPKRAAMGRE